MLGYWLSQQIISLAYELIKLDIYFFIELWYNDFNIVLIIIGTLL